MMVYRCLRGRYPYKFFVVAFLLTISFLVSYLVPQLKYSTDHTSSIGQTKTRHLSKLITVVYRQFEEFENDVAESIQSFASAYPNMAILVVSNRPPYPPLSFSATNESLKHVKILFLEMRLNSLPSELNPMMHVSTDYVLFVPDSTRVSKRVLQQAMSLAVTKPGQGIAVGVGNAQLVCQKLTWRYGDWTLFYEKSKSECNSLLGQHALLVPTSVLKSLPNPFRQPFPEAFYIQASVKEFKVYITDLKLPAGRGILKAPVSKQKAMQNLKEQRSSIYKEIGVKRIVRDHHTQWIGCKKDTERCFPTTQGVPSYILSGRLTPPCCRRNIKRTALHVLRALAAVGARCWLETTTLLGAVQSGDLLPWLDYAEVGIYAADLQMVPGLSRGGPDDAGFVWERATKGRFYTVAYSATNRVYTLVLPFVQRNGTMWPDGWVATHQREFAERHLHPLAQISFAGHHAPAPNDAVSFLNRKLGPNAIDRSRKLQAKLIYP